MFRSVARIQKAHGRRGEVVAVPVHGLPFVLQPGMQVVPVPPELKGPREYVVASCSDTPAGQLLAFAGVADRGAAEALVGKTVLVRSRDLPEEFFRHDPDFLVGREVCDVRLGSIGCIRSVVHGPAQDIWQVAGPYGEVLVPVVEAIVRDIGVVGSSKETPVVVDLPRGLVDEEVLGS